MGYYCNKIKWWAYFTVNTKRRELYFDVQTWKIATLSSSIIIKRKTMSAHEDEKPRDAEREEEERVMQTESAMDEQLDDEGKKLLNEVR